MHGQGFRLASGGAPPDARRLGRVLSRMRPRPALLQSGRAEAAGRLSRMRRRAAGPLPVLQRADRVGLRGDVRGVRGGAAPARALRRADPEDRGYAEISEKWITVTVSSSVTS